MGYIKKEDIAGAYVMGDSQISCSDCLTEEEYKSLTAGNIITRDTVDDDEEGFFLCDVCHKSL